MQALKDRRELARASIDVAVIEDSSAGRHAGRSRDIGELGMRFVKPRGTGVHEDREVFLEFRLPGDETPIRVLGWVAGRRSEEHDLSTSVTFMFLDDGAAARIRDFVALNAAGPVIPPGLPR